VCVVYWLLSCIARMLAPEPNEENRGCSLPPGCKDLIDALSSETRSVQTLVPPITRWVMGATHQLPFGARMTEKLFQLAQRQPPRSQSDHHLPSIVWAPQSLAVPGNAGWLLVWTPERHIDPERVFSVDGVSIHISKEVEPLMRDQVFDWDNKRGVLSYAA
jgi:hypothetical protein